MRIISNILILGGLLLLVIAGVFRFFIGKPYTLLGVRALSMIVIANTAFLLAILTRCCEKK